MAYEDFEQVMLRAVASCDRHNPRDRISESLQVPAAEGHGARINIPIPAILHVEVMDKVTTFHCTDFDRQAKIPLDLVETLLPAETFVRTHKSHLVNLSKITSYTHSKLLLHDYSDEVPIGRTYLPAIWDRLQESSKGL